MNAPVFEENAGKRFLQSVLDNLLFGISIQDENEYPKSVHAGASIFNIISSGLIIGTSFIPQNTILSIIIPSAVSVVIGMIYLIFTLIPKKHEAGTLRSKLSRKDQFLNIIVQPNNSTAYKILNGILAMGVPVVFNVISYYTKLPQWPIVFVQMMNSPGFRQINNSMAKYRPIDYFEPAMTVLIYTAGFSAISFGNVPTACVFLTLSPFCLMFGMFPQSLCLLYWIPDIICKFLQLPLIGFESIMVATTTSICYILAPVECLIIYFFTCLACASFRKNYRVKLAFLIMLSIINIVAGAVLYYYQISIGKIQYFMQIVNRDILFYTSLVITAIFTTAYIVVSVINDRRMHYTGKPLKGMIAYYYIQSLAALAITCLQFIETIQIGLYVRTHLNVVFLIRSIGFTLFRPEAQHKGPFVGFITEIGYINRPSLMGVSRIGLATMYGSEIYLIIKRMIYYFQFTVNVYKYAVKNHESGWQKRVYKCRVLLWIYNSIVILIASTVGMTVLPIAGIPVLQPFHHHPRVFFGDMMSMKKSKGVATIEGSGEESVEKQDDLMIYNVTAQNLILKTNKDLRRLFMTSPYEAGDVLLLLHEKQLLFIEIIGRNVFNSSVQAIVQALETQETTCHALERTKLESHAQKPDYYRKKSKTSSKTSKNSGSGLQQVEEGVNYTTPERVPGTDVSAIVTFSNTTATSGVVFENPANSQFFGRDTAVKEPIDLIDDFEVPTSLDFPAPKSSALGTESKQPAPIRRRPAPVMLGEGRTTRTALPPVRTSNRQDNASSSPPQQIHTSSDQKDEKFSPMWRYQGKINVSGLEESEFSLSGIFSSQYVRDIVGDVYVKLLYVILADMKTQTPETYNQATKSLNMIEIQLDQQLSQIQSKLDEIIKSRDVVFDVVLKICFLQGCKLVFPQSEQDIADLYDMPASSVANKQLKEAVTEVFRTSVYATIESVSLGDEIEASDLQSIQNLLSQTRSQTVFIKSGELQDVNVEKRVQFAITKDLHGVKRVNRSVQWECFKLPSGARNMAWSTVQADVLFFKATDSERFSAQALPECCKNVLQEAAAAPFGYPLGYFGEATL